MDKESTILQKLYNLSKAVEEGQSDVGIEIKELMEDPATSFNEMRYLEGLLLILGENPGELEDPPDVEEDPEEYWEEY
tara:strand:+ start:538 stop:771 length:234 start_codon:yes stop_codon:yes gene_type:complete